MTRIVVVGGGPASHRAVTELLRISKDSNIHVISTERDLPYDRPHLSKQFMLNGQEGLQHLSGHEVYNRITRESGVTALEVDRRNAVVRTEAYTVAYDHLLIATGSRNRRLPNFEDRTDLYYLRTAVDAYALRERLWAGAKIVVVGGGFIGLELAASAAALRCDVTVIEATEKLLFRTGSANLSVWALQNHLAHGIKFRLAQTIRTIEECGQGRVITLSSGETVQADTIVVGIGVLPNVEIACNAGLVVEDGIVVDAHGRTNDQSVYAAGEVTRYPVSHLKKTVRAESWTAAGDQAAVAARCILGGQDRYDEVPWLWSEQGEHTVQCWGVPSFTVGSKLFGSVAANQWIEVGFDESDAVISAVGVNMARQVSSIRRAVRAGKPVSFEMFDGL